MVSKGKQIAILQGGVTSERTTLSNRTSVVSSPTIFVLCEDGTIWSSDLTKEIAWVKLPDIPEESKK